MRVCVTIKHGSLLFRVLHSYLIEKVLTATDRGKCCSYAWRIMNMQIFRDAAGTGFLNTSN